MNKRRAFTLIELLVVIAIIALLLSILMPALRRVKEQANLTGCLANQKQWCLIIAMYVEDNDGTFFSGFGQNGYWWIAQLEDRYESYKENPLWFCPKNQDTWYDENHNPTNKLNIFTAWGIYTRDFQGSGELCPDGVAGSYGLNSYVLNPDAPNGHSFENNVRLSNFWRSPRMQGANNVPLLVETLRFDVWPQENEAPAQYEFAGWTANHMARCCINRHTGFETASFCDFSARTIGLKELWTLKWHKTFNTEGPYTRAGGVDASDWPDWLRRFPDY
ncbi:MAG: type II secretion system protein [Phycisphaerales bacterium]|nr:MAG: type II secretion system protein [Phycisphaerales bacterium]